MYGVESTGLTSSELLQEINILLIGINMIIIVNLLYFKSKKKRVKFYGMFIGAMIALLLILRVAIKYFI